MSFCGKPQKQTPGYSLVGKWFHSLNNKQEIDWQGQILAKLDNGNYVVQLYEWLIGEPSNKMIIAASDMVGWILYETADKMNQAYYVYEEYRNGR